MAVWAKIMTSLRDHPKAIEAGPQAMWLYVSMILYAKERDTNGFFPVSQLSAKLHGRGVQQWAKRLTSVGLVHEVDGGFQIVKYDEKQGEGASLSAKRAKDADRKRRQRERERENVTRDRFGGVTPLEKSREEQSRKESATHSARATLAPLLDTLEALWPDGRCLDRQRPMRDSALFDAHRAGDLPNDLAEQAQLYVAAHGFADGNFDGCLHLHNWITQRAWNDPLPVKAAKTTRAQAQEDHVARKLREAGIA